MKKLILEIKHGGLGDNLFYSPIPRLAKLKKPNLAVYISLDSKFRSDDIKNFVWKTNPYVDGFLISNTKPSLVNKSSTQNYNILNSVARSYGLNVKEKLEPEIYVDIEMNREFSDFIVIDLNFKSFVGVLDKNKVLNFLSFFLNEKVLLINPPIWLNNFFANSPNKIIKSNLNLKEYSSFIKSGKLFVTLTSGGATLAAALKKKSICLYGFGQKREFHHSSYHYYKYVGNRDFISLISYKVLNYLKNLLIL